MLPSRGRKAALLASGLALLVASGCCATRYTEDNLPRTKSLESPFDTVDFVRFCVRHELWDPLYRSLSRYTRKVQFQDEDGDGSIVFSLVFPRTTYADVIDGFRGAGLSIESAPEKLRDVKLTTMIHESNIWNVGAPDAPFSAIPAERQRAVTLYYDPVNPNVTTFLLVNEGTEDKPRWALALAETLQWLQELESAP